MKAKTLPENNLRILKSVELDLKSAQSLLFNKEKHIKNGRETSVVCQSTLLSSTLSKMPVQGSSLVSNEETEKRKEDLLLRIKIAAANAPPVIVHDDSSSDDEQEEKIKEDALKAYKRIIDQTMDLPLEKLILTPEGCDIFDELCLRLDVNQKYAELLPQWKDVAHHLQMDDLTTKWVEVCVRPREGLTRAMLEVYMKDGGTLGEVLEALLHLECLQILEETRPKLEKYLKKRDAGEIVPKTTFVSNEHFFSVIKTLIMALGNKDPCQDLHKLANGLKKSCHSPVKMNLDGMTLEHSILVQAGSEVLNNNSWQESFKDWPQYRSELHLNKLSTEDKFHDDFYKNLDEEKQAQKKLVCRVMLLFSEDGVQASETAIELAKSIEHEECELDMFRLNENSLWYEVLTNPEACCMKWATQADYIMPILTPKFLLEIHGKIQANDDSGLLPTSPILNKYIYNLARSQYTQNGCKNLKVRPLIPLNCLGQVRNSNAVKLDPLLAHTWKAIKDDQVTSRLNAMVVECVRRNKSSM